MNRIVLVNQNMLIINQQQQNTYVYSSHDDVLSFKKNPIRQTAHNDMTIKVCVLNLRKTYYL